MAGKEYTLTQLKQLLKDIPAALFTLQHRPKEWVTTEEARNIVRSWLPKAIVDGAGSWITFIPSLINEQINDPSKQLLGSIANGAIRLETVRDKAFRTILTHELVELIMQYGVNKTWKKRIYKALDSEIGDSAELTNFEKNHRIARLYEDSYAPQTVLGRFILQLKSLFNFFVLNRKDVQTIGDLIRSGYFSRNISHIEPDFEANYAFIKRYFGNTSAYIAAKSWVMSRYNKHQKDATGLPLTREEILFKVRAEIPTELSRLETELALAEQDILERSKKIDQMDPGPSKEKMKDMQEIRISKKAGIEFKITGLKALDNPNRKGKVPIIVDVVEDIFPSWNISKRVKEFAALSTEEEIETEEQKLEDEAHNDNAGIKNETQERERENVERTLTNSVKDFLSFIRVSNTVDEYDPRNYIPHRWAFVRTMQLLTQYLDLNNLTIHSFNEQLLHLENNEPINDWTEAIINNLKELVLDALQPEVSIPKNIAFRVSESSTDKNVYYTVYVSSDKDLSELSSSQLESLSNNLLEGVRAKRVSPSTRDYSQENRSILEQLYDFVKLTDSNITESQITAAYKANVAQNTLNAVFNSLSNLVEKNYYIAEAIYDKGKLDARYFAAGTVSANIDIKNQIIEALTSAISFSRLPSNLLTINSKLAQLNSSLIQERKEAVEYFLRDILGIGHLLINLDINSQSLRGEDSLPTTIIKLIQSSPDNKSGKPKDTEIDTWIEDQQGRIGVIRNLLLKGSRDLRAQSTLDAEGKSIYKYVIGNYALRLLDNLSKIPNGASKLFAGGTGAQKWRTSYIPDFINTGYFQLNPIVQGIQNLGETIVHDMVKNSFINKAWSFSQETKKLWYSRMFVYGFLGGITSSGNEARYFQFLHQPSDHSRIMATRLRVLNKEELKSSIELILTQLAFTKHKLGRDPKFTNKSAFQIREVLEWLNTGQENPDTEIINAVYVNIAGKAKEELMALSSQTEMEGFRLPFNIQSIADKLKVENTQLSSDVRLSTATVDQILPLWESFYLNNYINGISLNELVSGDPDLYKKGAVDVVKRQAGIDGPTIRPRVGIFGSKPKFKVWVGKDTMVPLEGEQGDSVKKFLEELFIDETNEEKRKQIIDELLELFAKEGYNKTDGAGFITMDRFHDLQKGYAAEFQLGRVNKPMHFQQIVKYKSTKYLFNNKLEVDAFIARNSEYVRGKDNQYSEVLNEDGTTSYTVYIKDVTPIYFKYSTIVLSPELLSKYPQLKKLNTLMTKNGIDEYIFASAIKVGATSKGLGFKELMEQEDNYIIPEDHIITADNTSYGLQFNPTDSPLKKTSNPSQLEYLINLLQSNIEAAGKIYNSLGIINTIKNNRIKKQLETPDKVSEFLKELLVSPGAERIQQLLEEGATHNTPVIEQKAITQLSSALQKTIVGNKFKGSKLILQPPEGARRLRYYVKDGMAIAEAIVPKELFTKEQQEVIKNGGELFLTPDLLGFRIPSTEIHSMVALKVVDFYDNVGTNVIIVPEEVMVIHGADYDVDSLFILIRDAFKKDYTINGTLYHQGEPIGYTGRISDFETLDSDIATELDGIVSDERREELEDVQLQLASNIIIESLLEAAVSYSNRTRMASPISKEEFVDPERESALKVLNDRGLAEYEDTWDLNTVKDAFASHHSVSQGGQLVGVFANNIKVLAHLAKSAVDNSSKLNSNFQFEWNVNGKNYKVDKITDYALGGTRLTWQTLDALVNLAIDNVKDQFLSKMYINTKNANIMSAIFGFGIPVNDVALLTGTNIWRDLFSDKHTNFKSALPEIGKKLLGENWRDQLEIHSSSALSFEILDKYIADGQVDINVSKDILILIRKLNTAGEYMKEVSTILTTLRSYPNNAEGILKLDAKIQRILGASNLSNIEIPSTNSIMKFRKDIKEVIPVIAETKHQIFDITNILVNHTHIFTALRGFDTLKQILEKSFLIHNPIITNLVSYDSGIRLDRTNVYSHIVKMRRELAKYILVNQRSKDIDLNAYGKVTKYKHQFELAGIRFWIEEFLNRVALAQKKNNSVKSATYPGNKFLNQLTIDTDPITKFKRLRLHSGSTLDGTESLLLEEAFSALNTFEVSNTEASIHTDMNPDNPVKYNQFQKDFVLYNIFTSGLSFGVTNYSSYIPYDAYEEIDQEYQDFIGNIESQVKNSEFILPFYMYVAIGAIDNMPKLKIRQKNDEDIIFNEKSVITKVSNSKSKSKYGVNKGYLIDEATNTKVHYDLLFTVDSGYSVAAKDFKGLAMEKEEEFEKDALWDEEPVEIIGEEKEPVIKFPFFIRKGTSIYLRVFTNSKFAAYQIMGSKAQADTSILQNMDKYNYKEYYNPNIRTIYRDNINNIKNISLESDDLSDYIGEIIFIANKSNIYRTERKPYKVTGYDETTQLFSISPINVPTLFSGALDSNNPIKGLQEDINIDAPVSRQTEIEEGSIRESILKEAAEWKQDVKITLPNGEEITIGYTNGKQTVTRLTDGVLGWINKYLRRAPEQERKDIEQEKADALWEGKDPSETLVVMEVSSDPLTKAQYIDELKKKNRKGAAIGTAAHLYLQAKVEKDEARSQQFIEKAEAELNSVGLESYVIEWVWENAQEILDKAGINPGDTLDAEVRVASDIWGVGSTIDLIVGHEGQPNLFSLVDFKFGKKFKTYITSKIFKNGVQGIVIDENPTTRAKVEQMLRAMILKTNHPDIMFRNLIVNHIPNESSIKYTIDHERFVEVPEYIKMIRETLYQEYKQSKDKENTIYGKLKNLPHFERIFDYREYSAGYDSAYNYKATLAGSKDMEDQYRYLMDQLRYNVQYNLSISSLEGDDSAEANVRREKLNKSKKLVQDIIDLQKQADLQNLQWDKDISWMSYWIGSSRDQNSAYIQIYDRLLNEAKIKANTRWENTLQAYWQYVSPIIDLYYKRTGKIKPVTQGNRSTRDLITNIDPVPFWEWAYVRDDSGEVIGYVNTEAEWKQAAAKYDYLLDENKEVRKEYKQLISFILDQYEQFFVDSKSYYGKALANKAATHRMVKGKLTLITNLALKLDPEGRVNPKDYYIRGRFFPRVPKTADEIGGIIGRIFTKEYWKQQAKQHITNYIESEFLQFDNNVEGIPFRYFPSDRINSEDTSMNIEEQFLQFTKYHIFKEELEDTFFLGKGLQYYSKYRGQKNTANWLEKAIQMHVLGRKQYKFEGGLFGMDIPIIKTKNGKAYKPDWIQILRSIKASASLPILGLKLFQGMTNFVFISLATLKESIKDQIIKSGQDMKFIRGIDGNQISFTPKDLAAGMKEFSKMQADSLNNKLEQNKTWLLAKHLNYIPDNFDFYADRKTGRVHRGSMWDSSTLYMFHSMPEEFMATVVMVAQLKNMKIKSNDATNGTSLWDMYETIPVTDSEGKVTYDIKWKGDYVRGLVNTAAAGLPPVYEELKGLTTNEARRMFYIYQRMQGGYRPEEKTVLEYYVLGEMFMQFKRYLPSLLKNLAGSRTKLDSYGYYKPVMKDGVPVIQDGKQVVEWHSRMVEGRYKVLAGLLLNFLAVRSNVGDKAGIGDKIRTFLGIDAIESYSLNRDNPNSEYYREVLLDGFITLSMWLVIAGTFMALGADSDDKKDPFNLFAYRVMSNFSQQWNILEPIRDLSVNLVPTSLKVLNYRAQALSDITMAAIYLSLGDEERALTRQGTLKGTNNFIKYWLPYGGSYYDFVRLILGEQNVDEFTFVKK